MAGRGFNPRPAGETDRCLQSHPFALPLLRKNQMIKSSFSFDASFVDRFKRDSVQRVERAMLVATDKASRNALKDIRSSGKLGRLSNAIGHFSDLKKGKVFRFGSSGFAASGGLNIKTRNERTVGAIISYTEGSDIVPRAGNRGGWLWFPTAELAIKRIGRKKITPALYNASPLVGRLGPLQQIPGRTASESLLIIKNVQVSMAGNRRPIKGAKSGVARAGRQQKEAIIAFIGIRQTSRTKRIDVPEIMRANAATVGRLFYEEMKRGA